MAAVSYPKIFNDERDAKIAKWNQMQAAWGTGKGWYSAQHPPVEFRPENPFCRFKAVGYAKLPSSKDEDGLVALFINKNYEEVSSNVKGFCDGIQKILSAPPQTSLGGSSFLSFGASQQQPNTQSNPNIAVEIDGRKPLPGIDPILWDQAKKDNPCPGNLIPVPMLGFTGLQRRLKAQELETKLHQGSLDGIASEIEELRSRSAQSTARRNELKEKQRHLGHRVIKAICRQEERRKRGLALLPEEEVLASGIEVLLQSLMAPGQSRGRLNELLSQRDRILSLPRASAPGHQFVFDESDAEGDRGKTFQQIEQLCRENQCALAQVIKTLKEDLQLMESCAREVREMTVR
ncbi:unnamed protein product [Cyprideis torosa]|uniref:Uncharacterized protein n=1 Tax=Cyprideis torosa TaxID=163714 RepID=A0A7R8ZMX8_9CRUS|nr:unnamed protein product [Cyprideis torosa]CAG0885365.1 unnamed protein product [Cyprideis torosa]